MDAKTNKKKIAIIGAGPAGCTCAYFLSDNSEITMFDYSSPMRTILPTGGGRCNLTYGEFEPRELVKFYPRGEKFLLSVFTKFSPANTLEFFENIGIKTYMQDDFRFFPISNDSKEVQEKFINAIKHKVIFKKEKVLRIEPNEANIKIITDYNSYKFDKAVFSTGSNREAYDILKRVGIKIIQPKPALVGLATKQNFTELAGIVVENIKINALGKEVVDSLLFTHKGISGPAVYKMSSLNARENLPYEMCIDFLNTDFNLQDLLNSNPHKEIKNLIAEILPKRLAKYLVNISGIDTDLKCHKINSQMRDSLLNMMTKFKVNVIGTNKDGETVTAGGVCLDVINPKTLESKQIPNIYFCGEILDIDGFCGGFNLQNCWSTGYLTAEAINNVLI